MPKHLYGEINNLLVGFGQTICSAKLPKCGECELNKMCEYKYKSKSESKSKIKIENKGDEKR